MKRFFKTLILIAFALTFVSCIVDEGYSNATSNKIIDFSNNLCSYITDFVLEKYADPEKVSEDGTLVLTELDIIDYDYYGIDPDKLQFTATFTLLPESTEKYPCWQMEFEGEYIESSNRSATLVSTTPITTFWKEYDYGTSKTTSMYKKGKARVEISFDGKVQDWCNISFKGESYQTYTTSRD